MTTVEQSATLPAALAPRVSDELQAQIAAAPRDQRPALLATGLQLEEAAALQALAAAAGLDYVAEPAPDAGSLHLLPARLVKEYVILPSADGEEDAPELHLTTVWPPSGEMIDWIRTFTTRPLCWHLAPPDRVRQLITDNYGVGSDSLEDSDGSAENLPSEQVEEADADAAVVRFVTAVISQAVEDGATDIHFEPQEGKLCIRYRVDGLLVPVPLPENLLRFQDAIISRLKIMARLNISERRLPQDGRISFKAGDTSLDIRVSTIPTIYAESISLRLLNKKKEAYTMDRIGMTAAEQVPIKRVLEYPHGLVLVTGPTGSGKSTSLNAFMRQINSPDLRIVTIEDPIEYELPGANQMQIRPEIGLTFAGALRHVLRQDPDVIMVGEIRDLDTAAIGIRASLTGHLVFSTLHTNDAPGAITRLVDMGVEPFLVASAVELVIAQRLVRQLCPECCRWEPVKPGEVPEAVAALGLPEADGEGVEQLGRPVGCRRCRGTGYRGRVGIFEIFEPKPFHDLIIRRESGRELAELAVKQGMRTLAQSGWEKARLGKTTIEELLRVISTSDT